MRGRSSDGAFALDTCETRPHSWTVAAPASEKESLACAPPLRLALVLSIAFLGSSPAAAPQATGAPAAPVFQSIGPLSFGADGVLFAADTQAATVYALELGDKALRRRCRDPGGRRHRSENRGASRHRGAKGNEHHGSGRAPRTRNAYIAVMRGQGTASKPALLRVDGAGKIEVVSFENLKHTKVTLPNAPNAGTNPQRDPRQQSITDMAFTDGRLYIAGLSNEEFASKLRSVKYPFAAADNGTSVEIFHGNHGQLETRSPVYAFLPYSINNPPHLVAAYLCTPLVKFPVATLQPGTKVVGTTIAELGNRNRPIDMLLYKKDGREFLLMSNTARGVMKIPTDGFATAAPITARVATETGGVGYETVATMKGIEQLDLLDANRSLALSRVDGGLNLMTVALP